MPKTLSWDPNLQHQPPRAPIRILHATKIIHASLGCALALVFLAAVWTGSLRLRPPLAVLGWLQLKQTDDSWHTPFRWGAIAPSTTLRYTPCFADYQCARLLVPLNWNASFEERAAGPHIAIAITKLPARVPVTDPRYGGPMIINPGGPGESGIHMVLSDGQHLRTIIDPPMPPDAVGSEDVKYFDVLSFDPRGVNNSEPSLHCFPDALSQQAWLLRYPDYGLLWESESIVGMEWARATALGASCSSVQASGEKLRYVNTAQVVEDMVEIIEKEGEWRYQEVQRLLSCPGKHSKQETRDILERTAYHPGAEKLQYWGKSYGTIIGSTFAAMHPDKVHRVVIDGVVDPADHYAGDWLTQLHDSDGIITRFCEYCYEAGPAKCPLFTGTSGKDVEERFTSIMLSLAREPIAAVATMDGKTSAPELVTYGDVHLLLLTAMYFSYSYAERLFSLLPSLESRDTTSPELSAVVASKNGMLAPAECRLDDPFDTCIPYVSMMGPNQAICCMDSGGSTNLTRESFSEYITVLQAQGRWISRSWARNKLACLGSTVTTAWRPSWTFQTQEWGNTSHPLLLIGNSHDTVTPVRNARRVSTLFPGSVVLQQMSEGHCSHSNPSLCTAKAVREYFQTGALPDPTTVCESDVRPFLGCRHNGQRSCHFDDAADDELWRAMIAMADPYGGRSDEVEDLGWPTSIPQLLPLH